MKQEQLNVTNEMTKEEAQGFFSEFYFGDHHFPSTIKECGYGWQINHFASLSTFDFNHLTRLVLMAHKYCFRVEIVPCNFNNLRIKIHKRQREGRWDLRHPTIEEAISAFANERNPYKV